MVIQRSDSISTISTSGSSQFTDARSEFTDARSAFTDARSQIPSKDTSEQLNGINLENNSEKLNNQNETDETFEDIKIDDNEIGVKTKQPQKIKQPKAYVSKEDKIRAIQQQKKEAGYQREDSDCHEYICSNNMVAVLDLPNWKFWVCGLCTMCCNTCVSSSTTAVKTTAVK